MHNNVCDTALGNQIDIKVLSIHPDANKTRFNMKCQLFKIPLAKLPGIKFFMYNS